MEENRLAETRIFTVSGEDAALKMAQLITYASTLGGFTVSEVDGTAHHLETGPESAVEHLRLLLTQPGPYRERWMGYTKYPPVGDISQAAVARVITDWLATSGLEITDVPTPRQLKDSISRGFARKYFPLDLLGWFIDAFELSEEDMETILSLHLGSRTTSNE